LKTDDRSKFRARKEDIVALLDALLELFQENKNKVTPKQVAERMAQKLQKQIPLHIVVDATASLGFITMRGTKHGETNFIIPDPELLVERRAQFCKGDISSNNH
jgi:hypothetical protein